MAMTTAKRDDLDSANADLQKAALGTEVYNMSIGRGFTLPTSDPGVAGYLYVDGVTVKVSAG